MSETLSIASLFLPASSLSLSDFDPRSAPERSSVTLSSDVAEKVERAALLFRDIDAQVLSPFHPSYPTEFFDLEQPPLFLSCLGDVSALSARRRIAIVGSRELSNRCERWMESELTRFLKMSDDTVIISGGARGADQAAHLAAVRTGRPTIVFLPSGLNQIFPGDLKAWVSPILKAGGAIVSAYAPDDSIRNFRFEGRNRLIAALSQLVFVTEASRRSGSVMTARLATELGRDLCVLPSFPGEMVGQGTLDLMVNGAEPIRDAEDLFAMLCRSSVRARSVPRAFQAPAGHEHKQEIGEPHGDERRQLTFARESFHHDIENVVGNNKANYNDDSS